MTTEAPASKPQAIVKNIYRTGGDAVYGLGLIGSLVYFIQHATTISMGALGVLKAIFWPALAAYKLLQYLQL